MSLTLAEAKAYLRVIGDDDDTRIQSMIDRAVDEANDYIDADLAGLTSSPTTMTESIKMAILILVERQWSTPPEKREAMTKAAHSVLDASKCWWVL